MPEEALVTEGTNNYVYVLEDSTAARREVQAGARIDGMVEILSGIRPGEVAIAVVGAHLSGMPLVHELKALGARFLRATATATDYRLFAIDGGPVPRPGLLRVPSGSGAAIEVETWALSTEAFGRFVAAEREPRHVLGSHERQIRLLLGRIEQLDGKLVAVDQFGQPVDAG